MLASKNITTSESPIQSDNASDISFSEDNYWFDFRLNNFKSSYMPSDTAIKSTYVYDENSSIYEYVETYKKYIEDLGVVVNDARLITHDEIVNLGCTLEGECVSDKPWLTNVSYFTGSSYNNGEIWTIWSGSGASYQTSSFNNEYGIRPVIEINKSQVKID